MADKTYFRVFDLREGIRNITNNGSTPYFHHSITGYHPAKLSLYQDLIENQLYKYPNCQPVLDMLNTKYILHPTANGRADSAALNPGALGPVWFVRGVRFAPTPRALMDALTTLDTKDTAIVFDSDRASVAPTTPSPDSNATAHDSITLIHNDNDEITYHSTTSGPRFAVFSEVYYNRGWIALLDHRIKTPIIRTNYVLRGLAIPAGDHTISFIFHPSSYYTGRVIQVVASILLFFLVLLAAVKEWRAAAAGQTGSLNPGFTTHPCTRVYTQKQIPPPLSKNNLILCLFSVPITFFLYCGYYSVFPGSLVPVPIFSDIFSAQLFFEQDVQDE